MGWGGEGRGGGGRANPTQANGSLTPLCRAPGCLSESTYSLFANSRLAALSPFESASLKETQTNQK